MPRKNSGTRDPKEPREDIKDFRELSENEYKARLAQQAEERKRKHPPKAGAAEKNDAEFDTLREGLFDDADDGAYYAAGKAKPLRHKLLTTVRAADIDMSGVAWFWPGRFALGKIGLIAGMPDMGKGQVAAFLAAAATAAVELPCSEGSAAQGNVIWLNAEDDNSDTVVPRPVAAGADLTRIHFVKSALNLVTDLVLLRKKIEKIGNVVLVIIDPVSAYLGVGKLDGRSATDVHGDLQP